MRKSKWICRPRWAVLLAAAAGGWGGCSDAQLDSGVRAVLTLPKSPQQYALIAFSDADPDARRDALTRLAKSKEFNRDWAIKGYVTVALLESNDQTRCIAIRALARTRDPRALETLLQIMNFEQSPPGEVRPPTAIVRWDAALGLAELAEQGVPPEHAERLRGTLLAALKDDPDYHVRAAAARGLGCFAADEVVAALIAAIRDEKFAVVYAAEASLVRLTGVTQRCSAVAWDEWYEQNRAAAFAAAGQVPESRRPLYRNGWEQAWWNTRQAWQFFFPGKKEK